ncbi:gamma-glutamyltransferase [Rhodococcus sp. 05-2255-3B1]|uniref:gamma-glutamyltransferase n=1 Tax=unclassified Rhodococcus (in: high G+C Gram-positive bacteria) TaxID=192944 RepID=UPI000B9B2F5F|nr:MULTISPECIES: gamma-glutamyltransferase [unclassified Rhodococcus (in: high G+C Gram-positive bacteria)]OZE12231.1 gamma-glutamyltransferase [Rhodococcus sp. 05-2255-3C]OZE13826.1 gamma-glutamyltransferase [Rhodococcus sp. 05-2255-3B1]OZE19930.1 gamma-glutamyltransferase [Rhodococcus sp. 05-2255-2A2]
MSAIGVHRSTVLACALLLVPLAACSSGESTDPDSAAENSCVLGASGGTPVNATPSASSGDISTNPEVATGYRSNMSPVETPSYSVSTANPVSTEAACAVLRDGGTAADALIVAQTVLGLVEPQSSGIGGGAFLMYYDSATGEVQSYDGRETAPMSATGDYLRYIDDVNRTLPQPDARSSGRSIGVPGVLRMLEQAHDDHGTKQWGDLFQPAIGLADNGIEISPRMASSIADSAPKLALDPASKEYFLQPDGTGKPAGTVLNNPAMSKTLSAIATGGADAFYTGDIAQAIVDASADTTAGRTPGQITLEDLAAYEPKTRTAVCTEYRDHDICGMPGPSSGGMAVASTMGILSNFDLAQYAPTGMDANGGTPTAEGVHLIAEAERLAYADRDKYVADPDFVPLPGGSPDALLDPEYLSERAGLIDEGRSMGTAQPGDFGPVQFASSTDPEYGTSHISVVDSQGNAASMTTTVESAFGSFHMVDGFLLNNQLTDFAASPVAEDGTPVANRVEPGKRPRSSMAPTLVFDRGDDGARGDLVLVAGSPGGSVIIQFVVKTLVGLLDWGMDPQQAVSMVDFGAANTPSTNYGGEHPNVSGENDPVVAALREMGHQVSVADQSSGLSALQRTDGGWIGGADPRREGEVLGG